ncbi:MAG TPA: hypothetical protein VGP40_08970, partial [Chthoniobacterales bacterium]|nr:hypothetical protein [Chthoniobacterales bacterium]
MQSTISRTLRLCLSGYYTHPDGMMDVSLREPGDLAVLQHRVRIERNSGTRDRFRVVLFALD